MKPSIHLNEGVATSEIYDCWNDIGVWRKGKKKCERLDEVIHCNNCKVFSNSGRSLLHRDIPASYSDEWTNIISHKTASDKSNLNTAILFRIEKEWYLAPISMVHDITIIKTILTIPHNINPRIYGLTNIRGEIMTCMSLSNILGIDSVDDITNSQAVPRRMLIIDNGNYKVTFPVDEVRGISKYIDSDVKTQHDTSKNISHNTLSGIVKIGNFHAGLIDANTFKQAISNAIK